MEALRAAVQGVVAELLVWQA
eukprot:COSAG02_NODE_3759_length_6273_cov_2.503401_10_plen_20_part_01